MGNITVINLNSCGYRPQPLPQENIAYSAFDDGKIRPNRHYFVKVQKLIPFEEADASVIEWWKQEVEECYWLYNPETDYFVKTIQEDENHIDFFVRTTDGGWFSLGWGGARLDVTGDLLAQMIQKYGDKI